MVRHLFSVKGGATGEGGQGGWGRLGWLDEEPLARAKALGQGRARRPARDARLGWRV